MPALQRSELLKPPVVGWPEWYAQETANFRQGMHISISGPTQSGKTVLARLVSLIRQYVVVFGTKPGRDPSLDAYIDAGYLRIDHWPPTSRDFKEFEGLGETRFLLWPHIREYEDLHRFRHLYVEAVKWIFKEGCWTLVGDEFLWLCSPKGLDLSDLLSDHAYGAASNLSSLIIIGQRPVGQIPPVIWTSVSQALVFKMGRTDDVRELASLGTYPPRDAANAVQTLKGHQFLDLPVRAQAEWSISEVDKAWV